MKFPGQSGKPRRSKRFEREKEVAHTQNEDRMSAEFKQQERKLENQWNKEQVALIHFLILKLNMLD